MLYSFREWRDLDASQNQYLVQLMPPADIIVQVVRDIIDKQGNTNAAIFYDKTFSESLGRRIVIISHVLLQNGCIKRFSLLIRYSFILLIIQKSKGNMRVKV